MLSEYGYRNVPLDYIESFCEYFLAISSLCSQLVVVARFGSVWSLVGLACLVGPKGSIACKMCKIYCLFRRTFLLSKDANVPGNEFIICIPDPGLFYNILYCIALYCIIVYSIVWQNKLMASSTWENKFTHNKDQLWVKTKTL